MPPLVAIKEACLSYGDKPLLDKVGLNIEARERICLVGRNGTGKTTLLRLLMGQAHLDDGEIWRHDGLRLAWLEQEVPSADERSVFEIVSSGLEQVGDLISRYHVLAAKLGTSADDKLMEQFATLQHELEAADGWRFEQRINSVITRLELPADKLMKELSGGFKRRVLLAKALVQDPELLLLDEPTNHLDIEGITWLEDFIQGYNGAILFITHDRTFLQRIATRIIELDRGQLTSWPGDYANYLTKKAERLEIELEQNAKFDQKLAQEEVWIRQGIKARRTRNEGRVRALETLREQRNARREQQGKANIKLESAEKSGKLVLEVEDASLSLGGKQIFRNFNCRIMRGDRVGIIGPNGVGKSSLIKTLLGEIEPDAGKVDLGTKLQVAYFDQQRAQLDIEKTVLDNLNLGSDSVTINGRSRHVISYLQDFLFTPQRVRSPVKSLSGGERNRLLLAQLFTRSANLLVMDEPTNDLDVETLELLEELLSNFDGTLLLVSHDRAFLDNVVTSTLVFEGNGRLNEYIGGYKDWIRQRQITMNSGGSVKSIDQKQARNSTTKQNNKPRKLSYKDQKELDALPGKIEKLELEQENLQKDMAHVDFYKKDKDTIAETLSRLESTQNELESVYRRWEELE